MNTLLIIIIIIRRRRRRRRRRYNFINPEGNSCARGCFKNNNNIRIKTVA